MNVNDHFNDFPIDYFSLEIENFIEARGFENSSLANTHLQNSLDLITKETLLLNDEGYISESLAEKLNLDTKNTSVVNCAVGQGKTTAILDIIKRHIIDGNNPHLHVIVAVPLVSLISQYKKDLLELGFSEEQIYSYENIRHEDQDDYLNLNYKIHLVTVNTLLGNPGENHPLQSKAKNSYLQKLSKQFEDNNKKVIFIYDEIHEAIRNFSKIGEAHLYYFFQVIVKNILLSATYNVQSIPVIKMLSELTDRKIQILESERRIIREQSKLFLHFSNAYTSSRYTPISLLIKQLLRDDKCIDILSYSKELCKNLLDIDGEIGQLLTNQFGPLRDCTSSLEANQNISDDDISTNRFDNNFCNIGTNFKSGVSINKDNHAFVVIMPPKARGPYHSSNGIFTEGVNSVIQAIARQRTVGEIHIILPHPILMDYSTLTHLSAEQRNQFVQAYNEIATNPNAITNRNNISTALIKYIPFSEHFAIIRNTYSQSITRLLVPYARNPNLQIPDIYDYIMENGEKILTLEGFLGKNLSSFVTYAAFTNQFYNARLEGYFYTPTIDDADFEELLNIFSEEYIQIPTNVNKKPSEQYNDYRIQIIGTMPSNYSSNVVSKFKAKIFKYLANKIEISNLPLKSATLKFLLVEYENFSDTSTQERSIISQKMKYFINKVHNSKISSNNGEIEYFRNYEENEIFENEKEELLNIIDLIKSENPVLKIPGTNFFREITLENIGGKFYDYIIKSCYRTSRYRPIINNSPKDYKKIIEIYLSQIM